MAIDSLEKRKSVSGVNRPYIVLLTPNSDINSADRLTLGHLYVGIAADPPEPYISEGDAWRQGRRHASFNALHGGAMRGYNEDILAGCLADDPTITATGDVGAVLFEWLENKGYDQTTLNGKLDAFAQARGHFNWTSMGSFTV